MAPETQLAPTQAADASLAAILSADVVGYFPSDSERRRNEGSPPSRPANLIALTCIARR